MKTAVTKIIGIVSLLVGALGLAGSAGANDSPAAAQRGAPTAVRALTWRDLIPPTAGPVIYTDVPADDSSESTDWAIIQPRAVEVDRRLEGLNVRLPGFVVPLEYDPQQRVREFLLVPYFGACLHSPPPPANQIVHVTIAQGYALPNIKDPVSVTGLMGTALQTSRYGKSAYVLTASQIEPFKQ